MNVLFGLQFPSSPWFWSPPCASPTPVPFLNLESNWGHTSSGMPKASKAKRTRTNRSFIWPCHDMNLVDADALWQRCYGSGKKKRQHDATHNSGRWLFGGCLQPSILKIPRKCVGFTSNKPPSVRVTVYLWGLNPACFTCLPFGPFGG